MPRLEATFRLNDRAVVAFIGQEQPYCIIRLTKIDQGDGTSGKSCEVYLSLYKKNETIQNGRDVSFTLSSHVVTVGCSDVRYNRATLCIDAINDKLEIRKLRSKPSLLGD